MELSSSNIKKIPIFSRKKAFLIFSYISGNGTLHFSPQARKIKEIHPEKISYIFFRNGNPEKTSCIFSEKAVFMFRETELSELEKENNSTLKMKLFSPKLKKLLLF